MKTGMTLHYHDDSPFIESLSRPSADVKSGRIILGLICSSDFFPLVGSLTSSQSAPNLLDSDPVDPTPLVTQNGQKSKASTPHTPETSSSTPGSADVFLQPQMSMGKSQGLFFLIETFLNIYNMPRIR